MDQDTEKEKKNYRSVLAVGVVIFIAAIALGFWLVTRPNKPTTSSTNTSTSSSSSSAADVNSLVSYTLPDGWSQNTCPAIAGTKYVIPNGTTLNCSANPSSPVKIFVDSQ